MRIIVSSLGTAQVRMVWLLSACVPVEAGLTKILSGLLGCAPEVNLEK